MHGRAGLIGPKMATGARVSAGCKRKADGVVKRVQELVVAAAHTVANAPLL